MNVVIPYINDNNNGLELRYAIRSMVKHFKDMTGVILIGEKPEWFNGLFIPVPQVETKPKRKEYQIIRKLLFAFGRFLYSNDDFFALQPFDSGLKNLWNRPCRKQAIITTDATYQRMYKACPEGWLNYDIHAPMVINSILFKQYLPADWETVDRPVKSIYGNNSPYPSEQADDCKIRDNKPYSEILPLIKGKRFFSTCDNASSPGMVKLLQELYPEKNCYEN